MSKRLFLLFVIGLLFTITLQQNIFAAGDTIRIVTVGNSITEGYMTGAPATDCYPSQLNQLLGTKWLVKNSGVSGRTMLKHGDFPIWNEQKFKEGLAFNPDIVTIMLGTNDSKPYNWIYKNEFVADYESMIDTFRTLPSHPVIWLCIPVPSFSDAFDIRDSVINADIIPMIKQIAIEKDCQTIDFNTLMKDKSVLIPDGIHPNTEGSSVMAKYLYSVLTGKPLTHIADENAAFGKQVTVSGSLDQSKYGASNLVDGNPLTVWKALGFPATATIDLGSVQIVDQFRLDFGNTFGVGYDFKIEAAKNQDAWSTVLDYTARTDTASVYLESTDSIQVQFIRLTITGAAHPKGDTINVAEFKVLKANGGAHAPVIRIKKTGVSGKNIKFSVSMVMPKGSEGAGMLLRYNNTTKVSYAFRGYKIGNPPAYTEYIKTGDQNKYYASSFFNGIETLCDTVIVNTALTDVKQDDNPGIPSHIKLNSCFPNPFNPVTMISYSITPDNSGNMGTAKFMPVLLKVFNSLGQEVATLVNKEQGPGEYKVQFDAGKLPSGTYFCRLQAGDLMQVQKMVLMK